MKVNNVLSQAAMGLTGLFLAAGELGLAIRFVLHFFAVDPANGFAAWVFHSTDALITPFRGVFTSAPAGHPHYVDLSLLFIMAAYVVVAALLGKVFAWATAATAARKR